MEVRTRFAPSPTGYLHIGGARTALFTFLHAKKYNGKFILRIEDTDRSRFVEDAVKDIKESLEWLGLKWDEGPYFQSERLELYKKAAFKLLEEGKAYRCFCTPKRLERVRNLRIQNKLPSGYDRKCRDLSPSEIDENLRLKKPFVIRLKVPLEGETVCKDLIRGEIKFDNSTLEDVVLLKSDGFPTYHLAHVVDDHLMKISLITRGEEWISSLPIHYILFNYLGYETPEYIHLPVILSKDGGKLSKRHGATSIKEFKELGYLPEALINFLALLGWSYDDKKEFFTMSELIEFFDISKVSKSSAVFSYEKLKWYNGNYIRKLSMDRFYKLSLPYFIKAGYVNPIEIGDGGPVLREEDSKKIKEILPLIQDRIEILSDIISYCDFFFKTPNNYKIEDFVEKKRNLEKNIDILEKILEILKETEFNREALEVALRKFVETSGEKVRNVFMPIRVAVTGRKYSPGLFETLEVVGKDETIKRIENAIKFLKTAKN